MSKCVSVVEASQSAVFCQGSPGKLLYEANGGEAAGLPWVPPGIKGHPNVCDRERSHSEGSRAYPSTLLLIFVKFFNTHRYIFRMPCVARIMEA